MTANAFVYKTLLTSQELKFLIRFFNFSTRKHIFWCE
jgi:hypothetical protein